MTRALHDGARGTLCARAIALHGRALVNIGGLDHEILRTHAVLVLGVGGRRRDDLGNDLGNLVSRLLNMQKRYCGGVVAPAKVEEDFEKSLKSLAAETASEALRLCDGMQFHLALEKIFAFVRAINKYAEQRAPWKLAKSAEPSDREKLETTLSNMAEALRIASVLLAPVMPTVSEKILSLLGQPKAERYEGNIEWSNRLENSTLAAPEILFPRIGE